MTQISFTKEVTVTKTINIGDSNDLKSVVEEVKIGYDGTLPELDLYVSGQTPHTGRIYRAWTLRAHLVCDDVSVLESMDDSELLEWFRAKDNCTNVYNRLCLNQRRVDRHLTRMMHKVVDQRL